jgi:hypothetical protein
VKLPKKVQFSIWTPKIQRKYRKILVPFEKIWSFSHSIQAYRSRSPGGKDGDPNGHIFYHNYGLDMAGFEGKQRILACTDGESSMFCRRTTGIARFRSRRSSLSGNIVM